LRIEGKRALTQRLDPSLTLWRVLFPKTRWYKLALGGVALAAGVWTLAISPVSPVALGHADAALGSGQPDVAVARYDAIAAWSPFAGVRTTALHRSALLWSVELDRPAEAISRLEMLLREDLGASEEADVREEIAQLLVELKRDRAAGMAFLKAYEAAPQEPFASRRLIAAARTYATLGDSETSRVLWTRLGDAFPAQKSLSQMGLAELLLASGDAEGALGLYDKVVAGGDRDVVGLAQLGVATCLERLGDLSEALADNDDLEPRRPDPRPGKDALKGKRVGGSR
jgi:tetratricopeptide (TPR) repeat protein